MPDLTTTPELQAFLIVIGIILFGLILYVVWDGEDPNA